MNGSDTQSECGRHSALRPFLPGAIGFSGARSRSASNVAAYSAPKDGA